MDFAGVLLGELYDLFPCQTGQQVVECISDER